MPRIPATRRFISARLTLPGGRAADRGKYRAASAMHNGAPRGFDADGYGAPTYPRRGASERRSVLGRAARERICRKSDRALVADVAGRDILDQVQDAHSRSSAPIHVRYRRADRSTAAMPPDGMTRSHQPP